MVDVGNVGRVLTCEGSVMIKVVPHPSSGVRLTAFVTRYFLREEFLASHWIVFLGYLIFS